MFSCAVTVKASWLARAIAAGSALAILLTLIADVALLVSVPLLFLPRSARLFTLIGLNIAVTTLVLADIVHMRVFGDPVAITEISYAHQLLAVLPSIRRLLRPADVLYYADALLAIVCVPWYLRHARGIPPTTLRARLLAAMAVLAVGVAVLSPLSRTLGRDAELYANLMQHVRPEPAAEAIGAPQQARVVQFLQDRQRGRAQRSPLFGAATGANVILMSAESLSRFPIGLEIGGQAITPRLSAFAREALDFRDFFDQTWSGGTSDAEFMALQSLNPVRSGSVSFRYPSAEYRGVPNILGEHGYRVVSMCAAAGTFWNMATTHRRFGFQRSYFEDSFHSGERLNGWLADGEFFPQAIEVMRHLKSPFFAFVLSSSNHHPFEIPPAHRHLDLGPLEGSEVGNYLHSVHYFDTAFGEFIDRLRTTGMLERTMIVVYGDHKGYIGNDAELLRLVRLDPSQEREIWLLKKHVPFLIRLPQTRSHGAVDVPGGHLDIAPTILALLGIKGEDRLMLGSDLTAKPTEPVVFRDGSFVDQEHQIMIRGPRPSCFDQNGRSESCSGLEETHNEVLDHLQTSDFIIQGNLIPVLSKIAN